MFHIGLDVHWKTTSVCILDENGKVVKEKTVSGHWESVMAYLRKDVAGFEPGGLRGDGTLWVPFTNRCCR